MAAAISQISGGSLPFVAVLALLAALAATAAAGRTDDPFYVISHMANSQYSLYWSVNQGANAIEADIQFDGNGNPETFEHRSFCDCSCPHPGDYHICDGALSNSCSGWSARNDAGSHLRTMASLSDIALIIMDGKVEAKWGSRLRTAGRNVVNLLENHLFAYGYRGKVVISAGKISCYDYVLSAAQAAASSRYRDRYFFSFDQEADNYRDVAAMLSRFTNNRVFGTGITSCWFGTYTSGISQAVNGVRAGEVGMSYIWTVDSQSTMDHYIGLGVHGIITNRPQLLRNRANSHGLQLASPYSNIPSARANVASPNKCDCEYHSGGCTISFPAPAGSACRCRYHWFWTCSGSTVGCWWYNEKCSSPDASVEACRLGGGDCGAY